MKLKLLSVGLLFVTTSLFASEFMSYKQIASNEVKENKKNGTYATIDEVKKALTSKNWLVADVRTKEEWSAARIQGSVRIGRQSPEKALSLHVLDDDDNFIKPNLIVVCNSAKRASLEATTFRKMGFNQVKIFDLYSWIDSCNPVINNYSKKKNKSGTKNKFGAFYAEHCKK